MKLIRVTTVPLSLDKLLTGQLRFMKSNGFEVVAVSSAGLEIEIIKKREQCRFAIVEMTRTVSPLNDFISLLKMIKLFRNEQPQIVHTHTPKAGFIGMVAAWLCKIPVRLHTVAGLPLMEAKGFKKKLLIQVEKLTYACASYVYPNSNELKKFILENKFTSASKLKVLGNGSSNGIDVRYFKNNEAIAEQAKQIRNNYHFSSSDLVLIFIGRIVKDKGINELVIVFHQLNKKYNHLKLLLVGPFEDELNPIDAKTKEFISINKNIVCTGYVSDVRAHLAASDVLVFPSYREGFPNVPLQAGCFNLPLILSDINGCNEIITNGLNGLLVPPKDINALQLAIENIINNEEARRQYAKASRQLIVEKYSCEVIWKALLEEYISLLHKKGINFDHVQTGVQATA